MEQDRSPRARRWVRTGAALVLLCALAAGLGPSAAPPAPSLDTSSAFNPAPPTNVVITPKDRSLDISWTPPLEVGIDGYRVYVDGVLRESPGGTSTNVNNLVNGRSYVITVRTVTKVGTTLYEGTTASTPVTGIPRDTNPPPDPSNVVAVGGDRQVTVSWEASTTSDVDGYRVLRGGVDVSGLLPGKGTGILSWTDTGLAHDTVYSYTVQAHDTSGNWSANSSVASARTMDPYPPAAPTGLTAVRGENRVTLSWTANTEPDLASYRVLRDGVEVATVTGATTYLNTGLTNDVTYTYTLVAVDTSANRSAPSAPVSATPTDLTAPAQPQDLTARAGRGQVTLAWTANTEPDLASYRVLRDGVEVATVTGATSYVDTGLVNKQTYTWTLVAVDTHGNRSVPSDPVSTYPNDPAPPTNVIVTPKDRELDLSWTAPAEPDIDGYNVYVDGVFAASTGTRSKTVTGLVNGRSYTITVKTVVKINNVLVEGSVASQAVVGVPRDTNKPPDPNDVTAVGGNRTATVSWTPITTADADGYRVLRNGVPVSGLIPGRSTSSWTDPDVDAGTYTYTVQSHDTSDNWSDPSSAATATVVDLAPAAPGAPTATPGDGRVSLSWTAHPEKDVTAYRVLRDGVVVATVVGTSYTDTGLTNYTAYSYRLVAVDGAGNASPQSPAVTATPVDLTPPAPPTGLLAEPGDRQVTLSWNANGEPDLASYRVLRDGVEIATVPAGTTGWTDSGVTNGETYTYRLVAVDTSDNASAPSAAVTVTPADTIPPAPPADLAATPGDETVDLAWTANPEPDLASYRVLRDGVEVATVPAGTTTWRDTDRTNGQEYTYELVAVDPTGNRSDPSDPVTATPADLTPPASPTGLLAEPGNGQVALSWTPNGEADLASYRVLRDGVEIATVPAGTTAYTDTAVTNDVTYAYTLVAVDTRDNPSPESAPPVEATPSDLPPAAPTGLAADAGNGQVALTWADNGEADLDHYVLLRDGVEIATVTGTSYVDTDVVNGTTYTYALVAVDAAGGRSPESDAVDATPTSGPAAPTGVTAVPGDARAHLSWTASTGSGVVAYRVLREDGTVAVEVAAPATSATVIRLTNGVLHRFTVVAVDADGAESAPSDPVEVTPVAGPVAVPVGGTGQSGGVATSSDGRYLVIGTKARLEASDTNTAYELYRIDTVTGEKRRLRPLAATASGMTDPTNTSAPAISDDGRYIALATTAKLLPADTNTYSDVYRLDTTTWQWQLVSVPPSGAVSRTVAGTLLQTGASVYSKSPAVAMSADGGTVLFYSNRADLVAGDTNGKVDLFAKRMPDGTVTRVSTTATGANLPRVATGPALALTPDGRFALFPAVGGTGPAVLYRKTLSGVDAGALTVVSSVETAGRTTEFGVFRDAGDIAVSDDGRYVAFVTAAKLGTTTPTANWTAGLAYRKDLDAGTILALGSGQRTVWEHAVELDPTGRYAFYSTASAALAGDTNGHTDFYRRDLDGGVVGPLVLVTGDASGRHTAGPTGSVTVAEYGRAFAVSGDEVLVTTSQALAPVDGNKLRDLYAKDLVDGAVRTPLA